MVHFYSRILYIVGFLIGIFIAIILKQYSEQTIINGNNEENSILKQELYNEWFKNKKFKRKALLWDNLRYNNVTIQTESNLLFNTVKIVCIILVKNEKNAQAAANTWAKQCNNVTKIILNNKINKKLPGKRSKELSSWVLLCQTLHGIQHKFDWILIVNDDTFVILENLRLFLAPLNPSKSYYLGHTVSFWSTIYNTGQAGYVISRGTLETFQQRLGLTNCSLSNIYWNREDFYLGKHLAKWGIKPVDTRDSDGFSTFFPYNWYHVFFPGESYYKTSFYPTKCCSKNAISFQAIEGDKMYTYYYILYSLQLFFDGKLGNRAAILTKPDDEVWKEFLRERNVPVTNITSLRYYQLWEDLIDDPTSFAKTMKREQNFDY